MKKRWSTLLRFYNNMVIYKKTLKGEESVRYYNLKTTNEKQGEKRCLRNLPTGVLP